MWTQNQINQHKIAAKKLHKIINSCFDLIEKSEKISEFEVKKFILDFYKKEGLKTDKYPPFIGFGKRTATPYQSYKPNKKRIFTKNLLISIDLWAGLNPKEAPFSDMRWIAFKGKKIPNSARIEFSKVIKVRDKIILEIKRKLKKKQIPTGKEIYKFAKNHLAKEGYRGNTYVGHSLGIKEAHGKEPELSKTNKKPIMKNTAYALEPGMYAKGNHFLTNEINFYISKDYRLILTTKKQNQIIKLSDKDNL